MCGIVGLFTPNSSLTPDFAAARDRLAHRGPDEQGSYAAHMADSYLYLGPRSSLTKSTANPAIYRGDEQYLSYLRQRESLGLFTVDSLLAEDDPRYFPD